MADTTTAQPQEEELPAAVGWAMSLLEPGTRPEVFTFFKAVTVLLVVCIASMLWSLDVDEGLRFHLRIFLAMSVCLMLLTIWFFGELQSSQAGAPAAETREEKKDK